MTAVIRGPTTWTGVGRRRPRRAVARRSGGSCLSEPHRSVRYDPAVTTSRTQALAGVPLFGGLEEIELASVAGDASVRRAASGRAFFRAGEAATRVYVLVAGRGKVTEVSPEGHEVILRVNGPGDLFGGVAALVDGSEYPVTARALETSEALAWSGQVMLALMRRFPVVAINAARLVALRLHALQRVHHELMTDRVERRIARAVLRLAREAGRRVESGVEIDFPLSRQDLAQMTGTTLFTVSRTLSGWQSEGLVTTARRRVVVCQPERLVRIADDLS